MQSTSISSSIVVAWMLSAKFSKQRFVDKIRTLFFELETFISHHHHYLHKKHEKKGNSLDLNSYTVHS